MGVLNSFGLSVQTREKEDDDGDDDDDDDDDDYVLLWRLDFSTVF